MIYLVNFATPIYYKSQEKLNRSALQFGVDKVISYRKKDLIGTTFFEKNKKILQQPRGAGYWIWKPYIILETMSRVKKNDIVIYCDSGMTVIRSLDPLFKICKRQDGIMLFQTHSFLNKTWTKRDCFVLMECDSPEYWNAQQLMASISIYINNERNRKFVEEWGRYCCNEQIVTDMPNKCGLSNFPEFKDHRHDQSVLSLLAIKHKVEILRAPCEHGNKYKMEKFRHSGECRSYARHPYTNSPYDTLLDHHRKKDRTKEGVNMK